MVRLSVMFSIVIVCWNKRDASRACLASLRAAPPTTDHEIILVDNGSSDDTAAMVREQFPHVNLVSSSTNLGFAGGANLGAAHARGEQLLFLNNDTKVPPGAIDALAAFARERPEARIWGGRTLRPDGRINPTESLALPTLWGSFCVASGLAALFPGSRMLNSESYGGWKRDTVREVGMIAGCFMLIGRRFFKELGGFDTRFFLYGEDVDLNIRARERGARPLFTPHASIVHAGGESSRPEDMWTYLLSAKLELARRHLGPVRGRLAAACLIRGSQLRSVVLTLAAIPIRRLAPKRDIWRVVWSRRALWSACAIADPIAGHLPI
ncbi:glycosyltransferase family 2 protein [Sphingomonas sp. JC676]|uniref:glycosyltransferase family 2 protein n=1 Tax=Sphingomonas sp. JC676 TaxID=2768065 RepID=UPI001657DE34|nr:glycosyltransferase family 2 protein [Sphingomonas sp. JC676]MBC9032930.1 glycosyltransferase family 2 protein [Sphingomonas sp. JC676]